MEDTSGSVIRFGAFELDLKSCEIRKAGVLLNLPPQPFKILVLLARHSGRLVTREEIRREIWGDKTFVDFEQGLNFAIRRIRKTLGDNPEKPRFVETLPRRGYRFIPVIQEPDRPQVSISVPATAAASAHFQVPPPTPHPATQSQAWGRRLLIAAVGTLTLTIFTPSGQPVYSRSEKPEFVNFLNFPRSAEPSTHLCSEHEPALASYEKGKIQLDRRTPEGLKTSVECFKAAIAANPRFAKAWAGLANSYNLFYDYGLSAPSYSFPRAQKAAEKALSLNRRLSEAHATLASVMAEYGWNWTGAEKEFKLAIQYNPDNATAHQWYSECLLRIGRVPEAWTEIQRAHRLDPLSPIISAEIGGDLYWTRRYDEAIDTLTESVRLDPGLPYAHSWLAFAYLQKGQPAKAIEHFNEAIRLAPRSSNYQAGLGYALVLNHQVDEAWQIANDLEAHRIHVSPFDRALVYAGLGDKAAALKALEEACSIHDPGLDLLKIEPAFDSLRTEPRFIKVQKQLRLPLDPPATTDLVKVLPSGRSRSQVWAAMLPAR